MYLQFSNGNKIDPELIRSAILRNDAVPVPLSLEAEFRNTSDTRKLLVQGKTITVNGDALSILKVESKLQRNTQAGGETGQIRVIAVLDCTVPISYTRQRPVIKEKSTLAQIYQASGASLKKVEGDFKAERFNCYAGDVPSFRIAEILQEEGGIVRWKNHKMWFVRLPDLFTQKATKTLPDGMAGKHDSGFLERHDVPAFYSIAPDGTIIMGNNTKTRTMVFAPNRNQAALRNMTRCLVRRRVVEIGLDETLCAGDLIEFQGAGVSLAVVTAAHVYQSGSDGGASVQTTKLWMHSLEGV